MSDAAVKTLVREVLAEELARLARERDAGEGTARRREERVRITDNAELDAFVRRLLEIARDGARRREIEEGRWVFKLGRPDSAARAPSSDVSPARAPERSVHIEKGMVTERQVDSFPGATERVIAAKPVRFTPLARDRLRQRGIGIERT